MSSYVRADRPCEVCDVMLIKPVNRQKYCTPCSVKQRRLFVKGYEPKVRWLLGKIRRELFERRPDPRPSGVYEVEGWE